jgi:hypothetical protein
MIKSIYAALAAKPTRGVLEPSKIMNWLLKKTSPKRDMLILALDWRPPKHLEFVVVVE